MKVVAAIDSMKGSIGSIEAGTAAKAGIRKVCRADVVIKPVADGGEGTTESMIEGLGGEYREVRVTGPDGKHVTAKYGILPDGETIVMEMAEAASPARAASRSPRPSSQPQARAAMKASPQPVVFTIWAGRQDTFSRPPRWSAA